MQKVKEYKWYILLPVVLLAFTLFTGFNGLYGQDSYEYLRYTKCLGEFIRHGTNPGDFFWPLFYPICGVILALVCSPIFALQLISILAFTGTVIYVRKLIIELYKPAENAVDLFVLLALVLSPYMLRASMVVMSDSLCTFFVTAAFYHFIKYKRGIETKHLVWFAFCALAAVNTRYGAFVLLITPSVIIAYTFFKNFKIKPFLLALVIVLALILPHLLLRSKDPLAFINHDWLVDWSFTNCFKSKFTNANGYAHYALPNVVYVFYNFFHPDFCFAGLILGICTILNFRKNRVADIGVICISILLYALFIAGTPLQNLRFLQLSFPLVALLLFAGYTELYSRHNWFKKPFVIGVYSIVMFIQLAAFSHAFLSFYEDNQTEKRVAQAVLKHPGIPIYTFSINGALEAYGVQNRLIELYNIKLDSTNIIKGPKLVLFNEDQLYQGNIPPIVIANYEYLRTHYKQSAAEDIKGGWSLYRAE
jgi:4-amino-4-deoxy-L-arabinose transferase-like glycosyltransferase